MPAIRRLVVFVMSLSLPLIAAGSGAGYAVAASQAATDPLIARGRYMVVTGQCNNCHTERYQQTAGRVPQSEWLTGRGVGHRGVWGTTYPSNLRQNVNRMSEGEWVRYAATLKPRPGMPVWSVRDTSPADLAAMYRFIKSLGPSDTPSRLALPPEAAPTTPFVRTILETQSLSRPAPLDSAVVERSVAAENPTLARGRYGLVTGQCNNCHTANYALQKGRLPEAEWLKGGRIGNVGSWGTTYATNLRIKVAALSEEQWVAYIQKLKAKPPMPWWGLRETDVQDLRAMYQFIKALGAPGEPAPGALPPGTKPAPPYTEWPALFSE